MRAQSDSEDLALKTLKISMKRRSLHSTTPPDRTLWLRLRVSPTSFTPAEERERAGGGDDDYILAVATDIDVETTSQRQHQ